MHKYIKHNGNIIPQYWKRKWILEDIKGVFFLVGKNMSGKTTFLKSLEEEYKKIDKNRNKIIGWFSVQDVVDIIIEGMCCKKEYCFEEDIVIIENLECLCDKVCTSKIFIELVEKNCKDKLFICTSSVVIPDIMENYKIINFREIKVNRRLISIISKRLNICLNKSQVNELLDVRISVLKGKIIKMLMESKYNNKNGGTKDDR